MKVLMLPLRSNSIFMGHGYVGNVLCRKCQCVLDLVSYQEYISLQSGKFGQVLCCDCERRLCVVCLGQKPNRYKGDVCPGCLSSFPYLYQFFPYFLRGGECRD